MYQFLLEGGPAASAGKVKAVIIELAVARKQLSSI